MLEVGVAFVAIDRVDPFWRPDHSDPTPALAA
jgi:hypothetical protein